MKIKWSKKTPKSTGNWLVKYSHKNDSTIMAVNIQEEERYDDDTDEEITELYVTFPDYFRHANCCHIDDFADDFYKGTTFQWAKID